MDLFNRGTVMYLKYKLYYISLFYYIVYLYITL